MSAQIINFADERKRRAVLREIHHIMWRWLPPTGGPSDGEAIRQLQSMVTPELQRLAAGESRLAKALHSIITILGADLSTPRARIDALWNMSPIDQQWFRKALHLPGTSESGSGSDAGG
jgi:hypothetical protein